MNIWFLILRNSRKILKFSIFYTFKVIFMLSYFLRLRKMFGEYIQFLKIRFKYNSKSKYQ